MDWNTFSLIIDGVRHELKLGDGKQEVKVIDENGDEKIFIYNICSSFTTHIFRGNKTGKVRRIIKYNQMNKFRLPRKIKKKLRGFYLLPPDKNGNRQWCNPHASQEEYNDVKSGRAEDMMKTCV